MTILLDLTNGSVRYNLQNVVRATATGQVIEYDQFDERFLQDSDDPADDAGVQGSFHVNTTAMTLFYKQDNNDDENSWIQIASASGGGGGGTNLAISTTTGDPAVDTTLTTAAIEIDFVGDYWSAAEDDTTDNKVNVSILVADGTNAGLMSNEYFTRLALVEAGAQENVQSNWDETDIDADSYIDNKPEIVNYDLTAVSGSDERANPERIIFSNAGNSFTISTDTGGDLHTFTPTDPSTGDFSESTEVFEGLDAAGATDALSLIHI